MPAYCKDKAVGVGAEVVGSDVLMGIEVESLPTVLVCGLRQYMGSTITDCKRRIVRYVRFLEVCILSIKSRIHRDDLVGVFEGTLAGIAGIEVETQDGNDLKACTEGVDRRLFGLMIEVILQRNHSVGAYLEGYRRGEMEGLHGDVILMSGGFRRIRETQGVCLRGKRLQ